MLVMTCRIGSTLHIGTSIRLTLQARQQDRVAILLQAPPDTPVRFDRAYLQPLPAEEGACTYLFSLQGTRRFLVGAVEVAVWVPGEIEPLAAGCEDYVHIGLIGPEPVRVSYVATANGPVPLLSYTPIPVVAQWH
jgi:hypothetical protein